MHDERSPAPSRLQVLRAKDYRRMPWKNGGGETTEIAVFPPQTDLTDFGWRISMATVASDGPFSVFPGIDRTLSILEGAGMELDVQGCAPVVLTQQSEPLAFPADARTAARLVSGAIVDLNVMTRRGQWTHRIEKRHFEGQHPLDAGAGVTILFPLGHLRIGSGGHAEDLGPRDCALIEGVVLIACDMPTAAYLIRITAN